MSCDNVVTALTSNGMIAPGYWVDPHSGNNYFLTVQYTNQQIGSMTMEDFKQIPLKAKDNDNPTMLENVADIKMINTPTEVDHYQLFRRDRRLCRPQGRGPGRAVASRCRRSSSTPSCRPTFAIEVRGSVKAMRQSFISFGIGLLLAIVLVYLILMAQFASFVDPFIILLAIPSGITGVILFLLMTGTTLNIMSLMGVMMMTGIVVSNSILIVDVTRTYREDGMPIREAVALACRVRLRPILMTSLATIAGPDPHGPRSGGGQRAIRSAGALDHRRPAGIGGGDRIHRARRVLADPSQGRSATPTGGASLRRTILRLVIAAVLSSIPLAAQTNAAPSATASTAVGNYADANATGSHRLFRRPRCRRLLRPRLRRSCRPPARCNG